MTLMELLASLGDRLGILEKVEETSSRTPAKIQTRSITLAELTSEIHAEEVRSLADLPAELLVPFDKIFATAGMPHTSHGWTIERLRQILLTDAFKNMERGTVQARIVSILEKENIAAEDLVKDAVARDQALDEYEKFVRRKMEGRTAARERRISELEGRIQELEKERTLLKEQAHSDQEKWRDWQKRKQAQERELAWTVGYLIDRPVITTDKGD